MKDLKRILGLIIVLGIAIVPSFMVLILGGWEEFFKMIFAAIIFAAVFGLGVYLLNTP